MLDGDLTIILGVGWRVGWWVGVGVGRGGQWLHCEALAERSCWEWSDVLSSTRAHSIIIDSVRERESRTVRTGSEPGLVPLSG